MWLCKEIPNIGVDMIKLLNASHVPDNQPQSGSNKRKLKCQSKRKHFAMFKNKTLHDISCSA